MGSIEAYAAVQRTGTEKRIHTADVIALLRDVYADGIATRDEAEELIAFDLSIADPAPGWSEFFAARIADHLIRLRAPGGIVDDAKAHWLMNALSRGRHAATAAGFSAVLTVIEKAQDVPPCLAAYAIRQLRSAVIAGNNPSGSLRLNLRRVINFESTALIRRILDGAAGLSGRPVSREEAEALFDLHDLTAGGANDAHFDDLFFRAISHCLIARAGGTVPPRSEALSRGARFPDDVTVMLKGDEIAWLASQIMRDGRPTRAEFTLLQKFTAGTCDADPSIRQFMIQAA